jgi:hypothetical protein
MFPVCELFTPAMVERIRNFPRPAMTASRSSPFAFQLGERAQAQRKRGILSRG